jgi:hypothetical protein
MKKGPFKGYLLEEALAYLIRTSGYTLIDSAPPSDADLSNESNGLNLRGRGAKHQIDVLGELNWIPAFNYPLRLMIEAKFRNDKTGIDVIRGEVGILADVNENYFMPIDSTVKPRYRYVSAVFSASGFSEPAVDMAIAHQVQLGDLSIEEYDSLKEKINETTNNIYSDNDDIPKERALEIRHELRRKLSSGRVNTDAQEADYRHISELASFITNDYNKLFIGMSKGGFMLLMKADDPEAFVRYIKEHGSHDIVIHWADIDGGKKWTIRPVSGEYTLTFALPKKIHDYIFRVSEDRYSEALNQKDIHFSKICITYYDKDEDREYIVNLKYSRENFRQYEENH